jgi:hypothetical protein
MKISVTATRIGLTTKQSKAAVMLLRKLKPDILIHGAANGGDSELHDLAKLMGINVEVYPAVGVASNVNNLHYVDGDVIHFPAAPLVRNKTMIDAASITLAFPGEMYEVLRSGTWASIRYARSKGTTLYIIYPNGIISKSS